MHSLITTVYEKDKNAIYRVDTSNDKIFYASLYNSNAGGIFPERIVFWLMITISAAPLQKMHSFLWCNFKEP